MSLIIPAEKKVQIVQDTSKFEYLGIPFGERYSKAPVGPGLASLIKKIQEQIDPYLDIKFYNPSQKWHLVRYSRGLDGPFIRVWELDDRPDLGLRQEPGEWMIEALQRADTWGAAKNREQEIEEHNKKIEYSNQRSVDDACGEVAKELRKPLQHAADHGLDSEYKGVF